MPMHNLSPRNAPRASGAPAGVTEYDDGATMDAAVVAGTHAVGDVVALIGTTTRALIALLEVVSAAPLYEEQGDIDFSQADGDEFSGVFKFRALGTATLPDWTGSVAGAEATGGPLVAGAGTCVIDGLKQFSSKGCKVTVHGYLVARSTATTNYVVCAAVVRAADETLGCYGGWGRGGSGWANCANADAAINLFTPSFNSNYGSQPDNSEAWSPNVMLHPYNGAPPAGVQAIGSALNAGQSALQGSSNDAASGFATATDLRAGVYVSGDWQFRINRISIHRGL